MPAHLDAGGQTWGVLWVKPGTPLGRLAQELFLVWEASEAEEWLNTAAWIAF
jgi:hypothetical protein